MRLVLLFRHESNIRCGKRFQDCCKGLLRSQVPNIFFPGGAPPLLHSSGVRFFLFFFEELLRLLRSREHCPALRLFRSSSLPRACRRNAEDLCAAVANRGAERPGLTVCVPPTPHSPRTAHAPRVGGVPNNFLGRITAIITEGLHYKKRHLDRTALGSTPLIRRHFVRTKDASSKIMFCFSTYWDGRWQR